jgi:hypothetical protein
VLLETFVHLRFGPIYVGLTLILETKLDLIQLLDALVAQGKILLPHLGDKQLDVGGLLLESLGVLVVLLLELLPKLCDELVLGSNDQLK